MIKNQKSFYIEAYTSAVGDDTSRLSVNFNVSEFYLKSVNRIAVTKIFIPNNIWQFEPTDSFSLIEGNTIIDIKFDYATFTSYGDMATFLEDALTKNSPNGYSYVALLNTVKFQNTLTILCSNKTTNISIVTSDKHIKGGFGLKDTNTFVNGQFITDILDLTPIHILYINTDIIESNNTLENNNSSIIATYNLKTLGDQQPGDLLVSSKEFNGKRGGYFYVTDFDNEIVPLNGSNWYMEISLFLYDESIADLLQNYIKFATLRKEVKDNLARKENQKRIKEIEDKEAEDSD